MPKRRPGPFGETFLSPRSSWRLEIKKKGEAATKSIELLPREVKDKIFDLIVKKKTIDVMGDFLKS